MNKHRNAATVDIKGLQRFFGVKIDKFFRVFLNLDSIKAPTCVIIEVFEVSKVTQRGA
jgi:hypothetical protein